MRDSPATMVVLLVIVSWFSYWIGLGVFAPVLFLIGALLLWFVGGLSVLLLLGAYAGVANYIGECLMKRRTRNAGRFISERELINRIEMSPGTLIVERPTIGWNITRAWWTPEDVVAVAPHPPSEEDVAELAMSGPDPFTRWCYERYTHERSGQAFLIASYNGERVGKRLLATRPELKHAEVWSGLVMHETDFSPGAEHQQAQKSFRSRLNRQGRAAIMLQAYCMLFSMAFATLGTARL